MFKRLILEDSSALYVITAFVTAATIFCTITWRALRMPRAQSRLQQALAIDHNDVRALTEMALVYEALNRPDRAVVLYERSLELNPRQPDVVQRVSFLKSQGAGRPRRD